MVTVSRSTHIERPVPAVFEFMDDPHTHAVVTPSLSSVRNVEPLDNGGKRLEFTYEMAGIGVDGTLEETVHRPDERITFAMQGTLSGEIDLQFEPEDGGTRLTYTGTYRIPGHILSTVAAPVVRRHNERELETTLGNVQAELEPAERTDRPPE